MATDAQHRLARQVIDAAKARDWRVATAESCTGGLVAACLTDVPGASAAFVEGFVTYANEAKHRTLDVPMHLIEAHGAVSAEVAEAMAAGAVAAGGADIAVAITGVAGPDGGTPDKPVGLVWFGLAVAGLAPESEKRRFDGDRAAIRSAAVDHALTLLRDRALAR
jgi:nicotinamide-nucleotide amidase